MGNKALESWTKLISRAEALLDGMSRRDYRIATEHFATTMISVMPGVKLEELWTAIQEQSGRFKHKLGVRGELVDGSPMVFITCEFDNGNADMRVVFDEAANVSGLFFAPSEAEEQPDEAAEPTTAEAPTAPA